LGLERTSERGPEKERKGGKAGGLNGCEGGEGDGKKNEGDLKNGTEDITGYLGKDKDKFPL